MTVNELLQVLEVSKQALNTPMKELLAKGLIELHQNDKDKRSKLVFLTDKGRELDQALNDIQIQKMKDYFTKAGDPDGLYWNKVMELYAKEIDLDFINSISETLE
ncbi:MarR family transcriptional regulator [Streptococcus didelphis]|uniref:MarR family transcriptional regulator n=2 Tax=Streptococcus didelphis TaxID=102886 RepID=A0ABY9LF05_9STRE|nr:MarR family transcriptional regulator [Streptococcus didelphis]WMB27559.1 MarR family transcriptional regulator [Streptococcus didelphis]